MSQNSHDQQMSRKRGRIELEEEEDAPAEIVEAGELEDLIDQEEDSDDDERDEGFEEDPLTMLLHIIIDGFRRVSPEDRPRVVKELLNMIKAFFDSYSKRIQHWSL